MTEPKSAPFGDPTTAPFWEAAERRQLLLQRCCDCGCHQFPPRPFCLSCDGAVDWVEAQGTGVILSKTVVRRGGGGGFQIPYANVVVELTEGTRMLSTVRDPNCSIGDAVELEWHEREGAPPLPIFIVSGGAD